MDPRDFHSLAARLARGNTPAEFRTAIGRAYYAVTLAGEMIRTLDAAFSGPRRAQLQSAIAKWRCDNGYP